MTSPNRPILSASESPDPLPGGSGDGDAGGILDHVQVSVLQTPPENDQVYGIIREDDPDVLHLADEIRCDGILEPLVVSADNFVISGNRRLAAARIAGLDTVPCRRRDDVLRGDAEFIRLVVAHNFQRVKTIDQQARELAVTIDPATAHRRLCESRRSESAIDATALDLGSVRTRSAIKGNRPLADACVKAVHEMRKHWALSDRQIHYLLLNAPPRLHISKRARYGNDKRSYRALTNILTRLRLNGEIPFHAIEDVTRPVTVWKVHQHPGAYLQSELKQFLTNYWRNLQQSQPNHIELIVEKLTVQNTIKPVSMEFTIPLTVGRGFASIPPRHEMVQRWRKSGKDKLVVIIVADLDPAGMTIAESFGRSLRDDFHVPADRLVVIKAALTKDQVDELRLPPSMEAKIKASTAAKYIRCYGRYVWELEAVPPDTLQQIVRDACLQVMDVEKLNHEQRKEVEEASTLAGYRAAVLQTFDHGQESNGN